ncbi:hypothetical protein COK53_29255 [Bacillus thuringiensis]|nr:hypothetical protein COK53_29255 [Bacillus thuringiensis]
MLQVPQHEGLLLGEVAFADPLLGRLALCPPDPAHLLEGRVEPGCLLRHDQNTNRSSSNCQRSN